MKKKNLKLDNRGTKKKVEVPPDTCAITKGLVDRTIDLVTNHELTMYDPDFKSVWFRETLYKICEDALYDPRYDVDSSLLGDDLNLLSIAIGLVEKSKRHQRLLSEFQDEISRRCSRRGGNRIFSLPIVQNSFNAEFKNE